MLNGVNTLNVSPKHHLTRKNIMRVISVNF